MALADHLPPPPGPRRTKMDTALEALPEADRDVLHGWLDQGVPYRAIASALQAETGVAVSESAVGVYARSRGMARR